SHSLRPFRRFLLGLTFSLYQTILCFFHFCLSRPALYHIHQPRGRYLEKPSHQSCLHHRLRHLQHHERSTGLQESCKRRSSPWARRVRGR
ncbi:hypothetical protein SERLADRAFT_459253, partial [Serpula lacrymans var. lacrymans S7.9]